MELTEKGKLIEQAAGFLKDTYNMRTLFKERTADKNYRIEHAYRVANIAAEIGRKEGMDEEALIIAGLLHDISYGDRFETHDDWLAHGRKSAQIVRPFLTEIGMEEDRIQEICYGIAIHVDGEAGFAGEKTPFALSVEDADKIDRFDVYRIYEGLYLDSFRELSLEEKKMHVAKKLEQFEQMIKTPLATAAATTMWVARLGFQKEYYTRLQEQLENSLFHF
ncbi:MAG: HD domain-containing protein [Lachnospiraceae bacterium]|nr:HD domain-containing protein [Lachnospiraceae bacterium]